MNTFFALVLTVESLMLDLEFVECSNIDALNLVRVFRGSKSCIRLLFLLRGLQISS